jgi:fibronectin type III domain protein
MKKIHLSLYAILSFSLFMPLCINEYANAQIIILPPPPPTNLTAQAVSSSEIDLSWTASSDLLLTGYKIERSTNGGSTWNTIVSNTGTTATTYSDTGLVHSTTYTYRVSAIDPLGTSSPSNTASATTFNVKPSNPTGLTATATSSSQINLSWTAPSDNGGSAITGYKIERSTDGGSTWSTIVASTGSTLTSYSDTGLQSSTTYTYRVSAINAIGTSSPSNVSSATTSPPPLSIKMAKSGLVASDPLNNETKTQQQLQSNPRYWTYFGDAIAENAPHTFSKDTKGLHLGVQSPTSDGNTWAGFFAMTPNTSAALFHSVVSTPLSMIPSNPTRYYENGMYVQTSNGLINYVTCFSLTNNQTTVWAVASEIGNTAQGTQYTPLYVNFSPNQPLTRDCTIITNGNNYLKVYLDGAMVYTSNTLNLQMPAPFNTFLEPQTNYAGQLLNGTFTDYYATSDENIQVNNLPSNAKTVTVTDSTGTILATAPVSSGTAKLDVGKYHLPLSATIKAYDSNNVLITSTSTPVNIFGGDVYSVS